MIRLEIRDDARAVFGHIKEGRFWKAGVSHRVKTLEIRDVRDAVGMDAFSFVVVDKAVTRCGRIIVQPQLSNEVVGAECQSCRGR